MAKEVLPLVTFEQEHIRVHDDVVQATFRSPRFANSQVHLVSIMGPARTGKSFLMAFLTGGVDNDGLIRGQFQAGHSRFTEGVLIYKEPVQLEIRGSQHAVFFLDTQGVFDTQTNPAVSGWIAGMSLLICDVQILNLRRNIGSDDLQELRRFAEFAALFPEQQLARSLVFLLRDSPHDVSGQQFIENVWARCSNSAELSGVVAMIRERFGSVRCVLSPPASAALASASAVFQCTGGQDEGVLRAFALLRDCVREEVARHGRREAVSLQYCQRAAAFLEREAPQIRASVLEMGAARVQLETRRAAEAHERRLGRASAASLDAVHREALAAGLRAIAHLDAGEQGRLDVERGFRPLAQAAYEAAKARFRIADADRRQREALRSAVDAARAHIAQLSPLSAVLAFQRARGLDELARRLLPPDVPDALRLQLRRSAEDLLETQCSAKLAHHFDDLEYGFSVRLRELLEARHFSAIPTDAQLRAEMQPFLDELDQEVALIRASLPIDDEAACGLRSHLIAKLEDVIQSATPFIQSNVQRSIEIARERERNQQEIERMRREEQERQCHLHLEKERQRQQQQQQREQDEARARLTADDGARTMRPATNVPTLSKLPSREEERRHQELLRVESERIRNLGHQQAAELAQIRANQERERARRAEEHQRHLEAWREEQRQIDRENEAILERARLLPQRYKEEQEQEERRRAREDEERERQIKMRERKRRNHAEREEAEKAREEKEEAQTLEQNLRNRMPVRNDEINYYGAVDVGGAAKILRDAKERLESHCRVYDFDASLLRNAFNETYRASVNDAQSLDANTRRSVENDVRALCATMFYDMTKLSLFNEEREMVPPAQSSVDDERPGPGIDRRNVVLRVLSRGWRKLSALCRAIITGIVYVTLAGGQFAVYVCTSAVALIARCFDRQMH